MSEPRAQLKNVGQQAVYLAVMKHINEGEAVARAQVLAGLKFGLQPGQVRGMYTRQRKGLREAGELLKHGRAKLSPDEENVLLTALLTKGYGSKAFNGAAAVLQLLVGMDVLKRWRTEADGDAPVDETELKARARSWAERRLKDLLFLFLLCGCASRLAGARHARAVSLTARGGGLGARQPLKNILNADEFLVRLWALGRTARCGVCAALRCRHSQQPSLSFP